MIRLASVVLAFGFASVASAQPMAYTTFSANWGYEVLAGSNVTGQSTPAGYTDTANRFTALAGGQITDIWVAMAQNGTGPNIFDVILRADDNGTPGAALQTWTLVDAAVPFDGQHHDPVHISVSGGVSLAAGTAYWLDLHAGDPAAFLVWHFTSPPIFETVAQRTSPTGAWNVLQPGFTSAFAIAVPGPAAPALLALCALGAGRRRRGA